MTPLRIRPGVTRADIVATADLLATAFDDHGVNRYLVDKRSLRLRIIRQWFCILAEDAADGPGRIDILGDFEGVAVWFNRTIAATEPRDYGQRLAALAGPFLPRFQTLDALLAANHPAEPHWHLGFLAVDKLRRRRGLASQLLDYGHRQADAPAYLEATDLGSRNLYLGHSYVDLEPATISLPDDTLFHRMRRPVKPLLVA
jgi:ribosomal protein S18 acetylase RimI-like enzyme